MHVSDVRMLPDSVREELVEEMYSQICERVSTEHMDERKRASWRASAKAAIEMVCHCLPDYLDEAKIKKYHVMRGKCT